jgi:hypothetical protein
MPNLIPPSRDLGEDPMSPQLRAQFRSFQNRHSSQRHRQGQGQETDDETLSQHLADDDGHGRHNNHDHILRMAMTTAISSQNEIEALMNGIAELEDIIQATPSACDRVGASDAAHPIRIGSSSQNRNQGNIHVASSSHLPVTPVED